ncbi:hypothetical protein RJT34_03408 [Clitoria ternatea]|uniref:Uncharacterized protein n=1 Tax=Clitoria ternatea TaxID=43366 RepID=A0AAN9KJR3_CLITE
MEVTVVPCLGSVVPRLNAEDNGQQDCNGGVSVVSQAANITIFGTVAGVSEPNNMEIDGYLEHKVASHKESFPSLEESCGGCFSTGGNMFSMLGTVGVSMTTIEARLESVREMGYDALFIRIHLNYCYTLVFYVLSGVEGYKQKLYIEIETACSTHLAILKSIAK